MGGHGAAHHKSTVSDGPQEGVKVAMDGISTWHDPGQAATAAEVSSARAGHSQELLCLARPLLGVFCMQISHPSPDPTCGAHQRICLTSVIDRELIQNRCFYSNDSKKHTLRSRVTKTQNTVCKNLSRHSLNMRCFMVPQEEARRATLCTIALSPCRRFPDL